MANHGQPSYVEVLEADNERLRQQVRALERRVAELTSAAEVTVMTPVSKFGLTRSEGMVLARIAATGFATKADIHAVLCHGKAVEPELKTVDVYISKIRAKLERFEIVIETAHGRGYRIGPDSMARLAAIQTGTQLAEMG